MGVNLYSASTISDRAWLVAGRIPVCDDMPATLQCHTRMKLSWRLGSRRQSATPSPRGCLTTSGLDKFAANYTQTYSPGITTSATLFSYAPCIISNSPVGAEVAATAIGISPLGVYITPEGANFQPEGFKVRSPALGNGTSRQGRMHWLGSGSTLSYFIAT